MTDNAAKKSLTNRLLTGFILGVAALTCVIFGGFPLMILVLAFLYMGTLEYVKIMQSKGFYPLQSVMIISSITYVILMGIQRVDLMPIILTLVTIFAFLFVMIRDRKPYIANISTTVLGILYCGWMPCHFLLIRGLGTDNLGFFHVNYNIGLWFIVMMFFAVLATDVGAWFFGTRFGKIPLCPVISPKKTVEGAIGGALLAILFAMIIGYLAKLPWYHSLIAGTLITVFAQFGDLAESILKRDAGMKDSSQFLPGHGGFLDRADSYIFVAPITYYYFNLFVVTNQFHDDFSLFIQKLAPILGM